ncbi:MAG: DUF3800 domain-containing protein [Limisphaerales bacterium]
MLVVYADETGTQGLKKGGREPAPGIYGFIETPLYWEGFRHRWLDALAEHGVKYFHFRELNKSERLKPGAHYCGWKDDEVDDFIYDMAIVASDKAVPFGGNASVKRTEAVNARFYEKTYKMAFEAFWNDFGSTLKKHFPDHKGKVSFFFDENKNQKWIAILNATHRAAKLRNHQIGEYTPISSTDERGIPCQAADLLAYVNRQNSETIYDTDEYAPLKLQPFILGRNAYPPGHPRRILSELSQSKWAELVKNLVAAKSAFENENRLLGKGKQPFYPTVHYAPLRALLKL